MVQLLDAACHASSVSWHASAWLPAEATLLRLQGWGLVLAGFGNLPGEMAFHDCREDGTLPLVASTRSGTICTPSVASCKQYVDAHADGRPLWCWGGKRLT